VRAPLLDHKLMERAATIPSSLKLKGKTGKYIFKKAIASQVPIDVIERRKQGFAVPLNHWFRNELRELARETLLGTDDGILDRGFLLKIWNQHQRGTYDRSSHLWAVLMYRKWREMFEG